MKKINLFATLSYTIIFFALTSQLFAQNSTQDASQAQSQSQASTTFKPEEIRDYLSEAEGLVITKIEISDAKRSRPSYLKSILKMQERDTYTQALHTATYLGYWSTGAFSEIQVLPTIQDDKTVHIRIELQDKWTLIIAPLFLVSDGNIEGGLVLVESNLFGLRKTLVATAIRGTRKTNANLIYFDPKLFSSNFSLTTAASFNISQYIESSYGIANTYEESNNKVNTIIRKSQGRSISGLTQLTYTFDNNIAPSIGLQYVTFDNTIYTDNSFEPTANQFSSARYMPITLGLEYKKIKPYGILSTGINSQFKYRISAYISENFFQSASALAKYGMGLDKKQINLLEFNLNTSYGNEPPLLQDTIGGNESSLSISKNNIRSNKYVSSAVAHYITVWKGKWGGIVSGYGANISLYNISDNSGYNSYENLDPDLFDDALLNGGIFISSGVLIRQVDIPLVKMTVGYNLRGQYLTTAFAVGLN